MTENQILDSPLDEHNQGRDYVRQNLASAGQRFANYIIDVIVFYALIIVAVFLIGLISGESAFSFIGMPFVLIWGLWALYFWGMEAATGKTVGKMITRTHIVKPDGSKPDSINVLGRALSRMIPFDAFSFLGARAIGWHDSIPKIYVIRD